MSRIETLTLVATDNPAVLDRLSDEQRAVMKARMDNEARDALADQQTARIARTDAHARHLAKTGEALLTTDEVRTLCPSYDGRTKTRSLMDDVPALIATRNGLIALGRIQDAARITRVLRDREEWLEVFLDANRD